MISLSQVNPVVIQVTLLWDPGFARIFGLETKFASGPGTGKPVSGRCRGSREQ